MLKKLLFCFMTAVLVASAATYHVTLFQNSKLNGKTLKPGDYKVEVKDNTVVLTGNREVIEAPARTETADKKFASTTVRYNSDSEVTEIQIGGTNKHIIVTDKAHTGI